MMCDNCLHFPICHFDDAPDECPYFLSNDLVEVVRCKDCKYYREIMKDCTHKFGMMKVEGNDFCNHGERKESK